MSLQKLKQNPLALKAAIHLYRYAIPSHTESYVFVATTGRSGSNTLANLFTSVPDAICLHEPHPVLYNPDSKELANERYFRTQYLLKSLYVRRTARKYRYYIETNHQFIKRLSRFSILEFAKKLKVIHLVREPVGTAISFYRIGSIPGKTEVGKRYLIDPKNPDNLVNAQILFNNKAFKHDFYRCLWYWYETEFRIRQFSMDYPHIPLFRIKTHELNDLSTVRAMLDYLNMEYDIVALKALVGRRDNRKSDKNFNTIERTKAIEMNERLLSAMPSLRTVVDEN